MNYTTRPPETLSGLIRLAVGDARKLNHELYTPVYSQWHTPEEARCRQVCNVCLAGAVIAGTLGAPAHTDVKLLGEEGITDAEWSDALIALNYARMGKWKLARIQLPGWPTPNQQAAMAKVAPPAHPGFCDWEEFETHLRSLEERSEQLQAVGL